MKNLSILGLLFIFLFLLSCENEDKNDPDESHPVQKEKINGFAQKGPFINGTSMTLSELTSEMVQTGKSFGTQIDDNRGSFEFNNIELSSQFVELKADGFYYDEVTGETSSARLILYALTDLTDKNSLNVNIMSHLEKGRIYYLISQGAGFNNAKETAQGDILHIFSFENPGMPESELLDISKDGDDHAILLAISVIVQGFRTDAELSELLANISTDIREDGVLDSPGLGSALINHARLLNLSKIRENLNNRYDALGVDATIPDFEKYVQLFIDSTGYEFTGSIEYPEYSNYGENILFADKTDFKSNIDYSMAANLPEGAGLKIVLKGGLWFYMAMPNSPVNWTISRYNEVEQSQIFTSTEPGKPCDLIIGFAIPMVNMTDTIYMQPDKDTITVDYYENMSDMPTKTKTLIIENSTTRK